MDWLYPDDPTELTLLVAGVGFIGGLAGALLGFISNYTNTSRQIARQERDKRRDVYGRVISGVISLRMRIDGIRELRAQIETVKDELDGLGAGPTDADDSDSLKVFAKRLDALKEEVAILSEPFRADLERVRLLVYELRLYGDDVLQKAGDRLTDAVADEAHTVQLPADGPERIAAQKAVVRALADFTQLARSDTQAPGTERHARARKVVQRRWRRDDRAHQQLGTEPAQAPGRPPESHGQPSTTPDQ